MPIRRVRFYNRVLLFRIGLIFLLHFFYQEKKWNRDSVIKGGYWIYFALLLKHSREMTTHIPKPDPKEDSRQETHQKNSPLPLPWVLHPY